MTELPQLPDKENTPSKIPFDAKITVVCDHGRTRSKVVKELLKGLGYERAGALGINDHQTPKEMKQDILRRSGYIVTTKADVEAELMEYLPDNKRDIPQVIPFYITKEKEHSILIDEKSPQRPQLLKDLEARLLEGPFMRKKR